ncbi:hypothetical protein ABIB40_004155 [Pedobacter sp. UYP30]
MTDMIKTSNKHFCKFETFVLRKNSRAADNSGFKKLAVQWLNQVRFFNQTFVVEDSFVLRNRQLLKPAKRYRQPQGQCKL